MNAFRMNLWNQITNLPVELLTFFGDGFEHKLSIVHCLVADKSRDLTMAPASPAAFDFDTISTLQ